ncbi:unnamed protein product [Adineta steineri]|uniref:MAM domain-containing protein n=1 Tax=Adineta steineri TaxID=433720 RepID=A0A815BPH9_9BILA|nr:unnamed protein product [Adineta steineri]CAF1560363.1 unnamed protein product [Adineta steineri]
MRIFQLKTETDGINGKGQQCLTYYYYMPVTTDKIINIRQEEVDGGSVIIDSVTSSPFNGWIVRKVSFNAEAPGYKIYFEVQRTNGFQAPNVGLDEISIHQGSCEDEPITVTPATTPTTTLTDPLSTTTITSTTLTTPTITTNINYTTTVDNASPDDKKTLTIVLATVIPTVSIILAGIIIWLKKASLKNFCARIFRRSSGNNQSGLSATVLELNRVVPA